MQKWGKVIVICCICIIFIIFLVKSCDYMQTLIYDGETDEIYYNIRRAGKIVDAAVEYLAESKDSELKGVDNSKKTPIAKEIYNGQDGISVYVIDPVVFRGQILVESNGEIFGPYLDISPQFDESSNYYIVIIVEDDLLIKAIVAKDQNLTWDSENEKIIGAIEEFENVTEEISK